MNLRKTSLPLSKGSSRQGTLRLRTTKIKLSASLPISKTKVIIFKKLMKLPSCKPKLSYLKKATQRRTKISSNSRKRNLTNRLYWTAKRRWKNLLCLKRRPVTLLIFFHVSPSTKTWNSWVLLISNIRLTTNTLWCTLTNNGILLALMMRYLCMSSRFKLALYTKVFLSALHR